MKGRTRLGLLALLGVLVTGLPGVAWGQACGGERYAVVIGIDAYGNGVPPLHGAARDARRIAESLRARGYKVRTLIDGQASREALRNVLGDDLLKQTRPEDEVVVYFSGHGETLGSDDYPMGYLMPADADAERVGVTGLAMTELVGWMRTWPAQRRLLVADACYSGLAVPNTKSIKRVEVEGTAGCRPRTKTPVTAVLVAGCRGDKANETSAGGVFTRALLKALDGAPAADPDGDGWISRRALGGYLGEVVQAEVKRAWGREQVPQSGQLGEGDFYLRGPPARARLPSRRARTGRPLIEAQPTACSRPRSLWNAPVIRSSG